MPVVKSLYFIAVVPPEQIQERITEIKTEFSIEFNSKHALKSPPHITLVPPFYLNDDRISDVVQLITGVSGSLDSFPIDLNGFSSFPPRVIYIQIERNVKLIELQELVMTKVKKVIRLKNKGNNKFNPHLTVAFRDLTKDNYHKAWVKYRDKVFVEKFMLKKISLLVHTGERWEIVL